MRPQELNLLVIFDTVMTENSITRTAEQLSMTQPAVSNAVARMRALWNDDLFVQRWPQYPANHLCQKPLVANSRPNP